jgi:hypothetical protein
MADLLSAASLLLAIVSVLYGLWYSEIVSAADVQVPRHAEDCVRPLGAVRGVLWGKALPVALAACVVAAVFLPDTLRIAVASAKLYAGNGFPDNLTYDAVSTSFCVVEAFAIALAVHTVRLVTEVSHKAKQLAR